MSFILDALKKSESDRQRQSGPALFEVKLAPPRTGLPPWAIAVAALLLVNLAIVMWMLLRHPAAQTTGAPPGAAERAPLPEGSSTDALIAATSGPAAPQLRPLAASAAAPQPSAAPMPQTALPALPPAAANPEDYAPAAEPAAASAGGAQVRRGTADGVPLYQEAATSADTRLPDLRLDLHVFAVRPEDRFVMINMHRLHEGDSLPEGVQVESITADGAVLSFKGSKFLLPRQ